MVKYQKMNKVIYYFFLLKCLQKNLMALRKKATHHQKVFDLQKPMVQRNLFDLPKLGNQKVHLWKNQKT